MGPRQLTPVYAVLGVGLDRQQGAHSASCIAAMV
jgi:hypothetical protein